MTSADGVYTFGLDLSDCYIMRTATIFVPHWEGLSQLRERKEEVDRERKVGHLFSVPAKQAKGSPRRKRLNDVYCRVFI